MEDEIPGVDDLFGGDDLSPSQPIYEESAPITESIPEPNIQPADAEFMGEKGGVVTGKGRMEAAFGTGDGDEVATAQVAQVASEVQTGTIFHQVYRPWRGKLNSRWVRNWSILR